MSLLDPIRRICGLITGPRTPLPDHVEFTLEHLQNINWENLSSQDQGMLSLQARAICNAEIDWAVTKWREQVENRPLQNESRRALDDTWRAVIRRFGGNPQDLLGPTHDEMAAMTPEQAVRGELTLSDQVSPVLMRIGAELNLLRRRTQDEIDHTDSVHHRGLARAKMEMVAAIEEAMKGLSGRVEEALANRDLSHASYSDLSRAATVGDDTHAGPIERLLLQPIPRLEPGLLPPGEPGITIIGEYGDLDAGASNDHDPSKRGFSPR